MTVAMFAAAGSRKSKTLDDGRGNGVPAVARDAAPDDALAVQRTDAPVFEAAAVSCALPPGYREPGAGIDGTVRLAPFSFRLYSDSCLAIFGPPGSGSQALGRLLAGLLPFDRGRFLLRPAGGTTGRAKPTVFSRLGPRPPRRWLRRVQMVPEAHLFTVPPGMTVRELLTRPLVKLTTTPKQAFEDRLYQVLTVTGFSPASMLEQHIEALSPGRRQRLALARALTIAPDVLVLNHSLRRLDSLDIAPFLAAWSKAREATGFATLFLDSDQRRCSLFGDGLGRMEAGCLLAVERQWSDNGVGETVSEEIDAGVDGADRNNGNEDRIWHEQSCDPSPR